jgi:hypothetical protein
LTRVLDRGFSAPGHGQRGVTAPDALRVDASFLRKGDLVGLIWASADTLDHPLLAYETNRDYAGATLHFRWRSGGAMALDAANGPTLTIEGRDASGQARTWYVRLWNFAVGSGTDAQITLPFSQVFGGWSATYGADPLYPADIDRMFISIVPRLSGGSTESFASEQTAWVEMTGIRCDGRGAMLSIGDVYVPPHGLAMATAYDDSCNQTPDRLIRTMRQLGYRGSVLHYVGMSHHYRLTPSGDGFVVDGAGDALCAPARAWHGSFFAAAGRGIFSHRVGVLRSVGPELPRRVAATRGRWFARPHRVEPALGAALARQGGGGGVACDTGAGLCWADGRRAGCAASASGRTLVVGDGRWPHLSV